jgi:hypothetical protein
MPTTVRSTALCQLIKLSTIQKRSSKKNGPEESAHIGNDTAIAGTFSSILLDSTEARLRWAALLETVDSTPAGNYPQATGVSSHVSRLLPHARIRPALFDAI